MKVYLSHSRHDGDLAEQLIAGLRSAGHEVLSDRELAPGEAWQSSITRMIDNADIVLVLWSEGSVSSHFVRMEAERATELNKYLGVLVGDVELPLQFGRIHHLRVSGSGRALDTSVILSEIERFEVRSATPRSSNRTVRQASKRRSPPPQEQAVSVSSAISPGAGFAWRAAAPAAQDTSQSDQLEIPAFLRREGSGPSESQRAEAPEAVSFISDILEPAPPTLPVASAGVPQREQYDVFISYSRKDTKACKLAFDLMVDQGLTPWYDKDIGGGAFKSKIVTRISDSAVFVLLLSKNSIGSANVSKELSVASSKDRLIIPVSIDGTQPDDLGDTFRYELIELNIFEANPEAADTWSSVVRTIVDSVAEVRAEAALPPPTPTVQLMRAATAVATPEMPRPKRQRPIMLALLTVASALLQQTAIGFVLWRSGWALELATALAFAAGIVVWPAAYATAWLARAALRDRSAGRPGQA